MYGLNFDVLFELNIVKNSSYSNVITVIVCDITWYNAQAHLYIKKVFVHLDVITLYLSQIVKAPHGIIGKPLTMWCAPLSFCNFQSNGAKLLNLKWFLPLEIK